MATKTTEQALIQKSTAWLVRVAFENENEIFSNREKFVFWKSFDSKV